MADAKAEVDAQIGKRVAGLRATAGLAQEAVAAQMSADGWRWVQATVWAVEAGRRSLRLAEAGTLARVLNVRVDELLYDRLDGLVASLLRQERRLRTAASQGVLAHEDAELQLRVFEALADTRAGGPGMPPANGDTLAHFVGTAFSAQDWTEDVRPVLSALGMSDDALAALEGTHGIAADAFYAAFVALRRAEGPELVAYGRGVIEALPPTRIWDLWRTALAVQGGAR